MSRKRIGKIVILVIITLMILFACNLPDKQAHSVLTPTSTTVKSTGTTEGQDITPGISQEMTQEVTPEIVTDEPMIIPTAEIFYVAPVTSPTNELSQDITVYVGRGEEVTVITESGTFTVQGEFDAYNNPAIVTINLLPNTIHHLQVNVTTKFDPNCTGIECGGSVMNTSMDQYGNPLVIVQGEPKVIQPNVVISSDNAMGLTLLGTISPQSTTTNDLAFYGNTTLASVGYTPGIYIWDTTDASLLRTLGEDSIPGAMVTILSPDQKTVAIGGTAGDNTVKIMDIETGSIKELGIHDGYVTSLSYSPDGSLLASGANDNTVRVWNVSTGEMVTQLDGDIAEFIQSFDRLFWQDANTLAAIGNEAIYWWDIPSGNQIKRTDKPVEAPFFVAGDFRFDGQQIAVAAQDDNLYLYSVSSDEWRVIPANLGIEMNTVTYSPDGNLLAYGSYNNSIAVWDAQTETHLISLDVITDTIEDLSFSPDGKYLAALGWQGPIWLWGVP